MNTVRRFGFTVMLIGALLAVASALMVSIPLGLLLAGALCVALGTVVLRGSKP